MNAIAQTHSKQLVRALGNEHHMRNLMRAHLAVAELDAKGIAVIEVDLKDLGVPQITVAPSFRCAQLKGVQTGISSNAVGRLVHHQAVVQECRVVWHST